MAEELKPCPLMHNPAEHRVEVKAHRVVCSCGAMGPWKANPTFAALVWNQRPREQALEAALREATVFVDDAKTMLQCIKGYKRNQTFIEAYKSLVQASATLSQSNSNSVEG